MITNAAIDSELVRAVADEQLATNVFMVEWLVKVQQQLSLQQRLIENKDQQISAQQQEIEKLKEERDKLKNRDSKNSSVPPSSDHLKTSRFQGNRQFAHDVQLVLGKARMAHRHYHAGILNLSELSS
ncbi:MAG: hypothetical protein AB4060_19330, partial [Crocosphaera sp.]